MIDARKRPIEPNTRLTVPLVEPDKVVRNRRSPARSATAPRTEGPRTSNGFPTREHQTRVEATANPAARTGQANCLGELPSLPHTTVRVAQSSVGERAPGSAVHRYHSYRDAVMHGSTPSIRQDPVPSDVRDALRAKVVSKTVNQTRKVRPIGVTTGPSPLIAQTASNRMPTDEPILTSRRSTSSVDATHLVRQMPRCCYAPFAVPPTSLRVAESSDDTQSVGPHESRTQRSSGTLESDSPSETDHPIGQLYSLTPLFAISVKIRTTECVALIDSGATGNFISETFAAQLGCKRRPLKRPGHAKTAGGELLTVDTFIRVTARMENVSLRLSLCVVAMQPTLILGYNFLNHFNPVIDWRAKP